MDSTDKKSRSCETDAKVSMPEGDAQHQVEHRDLGDVEDLKKNVPPQHAQDPFGGEEGAQVQYRSMNWWYVVVFS